MTVTAMAAPRVAVHPSHGPVTRIAREQVAGAWLWRYRCTVGDLDVLIPDARLGTLRAPIHRSDLDHIAEILSTPSPRYPQSFQRRLQNAQKGMAEAPDAATLARIVRIFAHRLTVGCSDAEHRMLEVAWVRLVAELAMAGVRHPARWVAGHCPDPTPEES